MSHLYNFANFFFLALALLFVYYNAVRLRMALKKVREQHALAEKFRALFHKTVEGVVQTDLEGNIKVINDAGARMLGYKDSEEVVSASINVGQFYRYPEMREQVRQKIFKGGLKNYRLDVVTKDATYAVISMSFHPILDENNRVIGVEGIFHDVTDRVQMEQQLLEYSENLESKVKEKTDEVIALERKKFDLEKLAAVGQMASTLVHELRNPLSSIKMGLTTLLRRITLQDQDKHILEVSIREVAHLERIMKDILDFARPQKLQFVIQPIETIIQTAIDRMHESYHHANLTIQTELSDNLPKIPLDTDKMIQVFVNLLMNARDATEPGGRVGIRAALKPDSSVIRIEIKDTGKGIAPDALEHLFEPFYSRKSGGTGLGLTVVEKFVSAHGGHVSIESQEGQGTEVVLKLPTDHKISVEQV